MNLRGIEVSYAKCHPKRPHTGVSHAKYQPENCTLGKQGQQHYVLLHVTERERTSVCQESGRARSEARTTETEGNPSI